MKTVLVTGASGLLGRAVVAELVKNRNYQVTAVVSGRRKVEFPDGVHIEACDLLSESERVSLIERTKPEVLCHLAWGQETADFRNSESNLQWLEASSSILRLFVKNGGKRFFFAGSSSEYDWSDGKHYVIPRPRQMSLYGECKRAFSQILENYGLRTGISFVDGRFFTIYGPNDGHSFGAIPYAIRSFLRGEPVVCKAPNTIRDYIYIEDAAKATVLLINGDFNGSINICGGQPHSMRSVFTLLARELNREDLLSFENENRCDLILVGDNSILKEKVGFSEFISFDQGIREVLRFWKNMDAGGGYFPDVREVLGIASGPEMEAMAA